MLHWLERARISLYCLYTDDRYIRQMAEMARPRQMKKNGGGSRRASVQIGFFTRASDHTTTLSKETS